jgi:hypothetical protein
MNILALLKSICSACSWPEKATLAAALLIVMIMVFTWVVLALFAGSIHDTGLNKAAFRWLLDSELTFIPPLWVVLRATQVAFHKLRH